MGADSRIKVPTASLSTRLAVISGLLVAASLTFVIGLTLRLAHVYLTRELDFRLMATVTEFREGPARYIEHPQDLDREAGIWLADHAFAPDEIVAIRVQGGLVLTGAGGLDLRQVTGARALLEATDTQWRILDGPGGRVRAVAVPLVLGGRQIGTLVAASSKARLGATTRALGWRIITLGVTGLLLALLAGFFAVRRSTRPISQVLMQIEAIHAAGDLSRRLSHTGPRDEIGRLAEAFDRMLGRLEQTFRSHQRFVADASHELRTPLALIRGHLELLQRDIEGATARRSLTIATGELDRLGRIVNDLLLLAHLDEGGLMLSMQAVDVDLVAREAVLRGLQLARRRADIQVEPGLQVHADPDRLLQVLTNLIVNAAVHGGEGVTIAVTGRRDGERVIITVADTGAGIPADDLPHIFERFYRGSRAKAASGGVGLGLAIATSLVGAMDGEITVESPPGAGATFRIMLRRANPTVPSTPRKNRLGSPMPASPKPAH